MTEPNPFDNFPAPEGQVPVPGIAPPEGLKQPLEPIDGVVVVPVVEPHEFNVSVAAGIAEGMVYPSVLTPAKAEAESTREIPTEVIVDAVKKTFPDKKTQQAQGWKADRLHKVTEEVAQKLEAHEKAELLEIVSQRTLDGHEIPEYMGKWTLGDDETKMTQFVGIFGQDSELARAMARGNVVGFHTTGSGALPGILEHGALLTAAEAGTRGIALNTGERTFSVEGGQVSMSFADWRDPDDIRHFANMCAPTTIEELETLHADTNRALTEGEITSTTFVRNLKRQLTDLTDRLAFMKANPDSLETSLILRNFPVAFGISGDGYEHFKLPKEARASGVDAFAHNVRSTHDGEFILLAKEAKLDRFPVILTDSEHIEEVRELFAAYGHDNITVSDISSVTQRYKETSSS